MLTLMPLSGRPQLHVNIYLLAAIAALPKKPALAALAALAAISGFSGQNSSLGNTPVASHVGHVQHQMPMIHSINEQCKRKPTSSLDIEITLS